MKNLIFLPIDLNIGGDFFDVDQPMISTFGGLWNTKVLGQEQYDHPFIRSITSQLPFKEITLIKLNVQARDVPPHVDVKLGYVKNLKEFSHIKENEPAGYRIILKGKNDALEVFDGKHWQNCEVPKTPFAYVLNSTNTLHRVTDQSDRLTLYFRGYLDIDKHQQLIESNLSKYREYAIFAQ